jgi:hypothetical protein
MRFGLHRMPAMIAALGRSLGRPYKFGQWCGRSPEKRFRSRTFPGCLELVLAESIYCSVIATAHAELGEALTNQVNGVGGYYRVRR